MNTVKSSPFSLSKSRKSIRSPAPSNDKIGKVFHPDPNPLSVKTPRKPVDRPRRSRQAGAALSIKEIREAALNLRQQESTSHDRTDPTLGFKKEQVAKVKQEPLDSEINLPEKYEMLVEFFNSLDSSIRLLQRQRYRTTFTNIRPHIETLTGWRFTHSNLAQLKFIMPEAILLETVSQRDEWTGNLKPDLLITLNFQVVGSKNMSISVIKNMQLRKLFRDRLLDFSKSHPEGDQVPEEALPEPFNLSKGTSPNSVPSPEETCIIQKCPETPVKCMNTIKDEDQSPLLRTPVDLVSTPAKVRIATPNLQPSKRCYMSPDDNSPRSPNKLVRRLPPNRPLKFDTPVKASVNDNDVFDILPEALVQSIREKERLASIEQDPAISQAKWRRRMIAQLPKLFDLVYMLFQSIGRSVVTKEELIHKIILGHLDITERKEIEEQLKLLQELAPEWIYEKLAISGDLIMCVNKISSPQTIRTRLYEALMRESRQH